MSEKKFGYVQVNGALCASIMYNNDAKDFAQPTAPLRAVYRKSPTASTFLFETLPLEIMKRFAKPFLCSTEEVTVTGKLFQYVRMYIRAAVYPRVSQALLRGTRPNPTFINWEVPRVQKSPGHLWGALSTRPWRSGRRASARRRSRTSGCPSSRCSPRRRWCRRAPRQGSGPPRTHATFGAERTGAQISGCF